MKRLSFLLALCLLLPGITACHDEQRPADVIATDTMTDFLTDLYLVEGYYAVESQYRFDTASTEVVEALQSLFVKYRLTRERVEKSFDYYSLHPEEYEAIQNEVAARLEQLIAADEEARQGQEPDTPRRATREAFPGRLLDPR